MVPFYPWFKFNFPLFQTHYHTLQYPKTKENKIGTKDKIEPQQIHGLHMTQHYTILKQSIRGSIVSVIVFFIQELNA